MPSLEDKIKDLLENADQAPVVDQEEVIAEGEAGADNAKIESGKGKKFEDKKVTGSPSTDEPNNKKNHVDKNPVSVKEHVDALTVGEDLSEEFKQKAAVILEAAITDGVAKEMDRLNEEFEARLEESVQEVQSELVENIDAFLTSVVEAWVDENKIALESGIKNDILEGFVDGLKDLFKEHYIEVPEEKLDVLDEQAEAIEVLTKNLDESVVAIEELKHEVAKLQRDRVMEGVGSTLTMTDREKFKSLCEGLSFDSEEDFADKVKTIKESHFPKTKPGSVIAENDAPVQSTLVEGVMGKYVEALSGSLKFKR